MGTDIKIAVLASGRGSNFKALAEATSDESFPAKTVLLMVDNPDAGALAYASKSGIAAEVVDCGSRRGSMTPESSESMAELCARHEIDLICLAGFMRIVKGKLLDRYAGRMMNIHPALLPSFKGLDAQEQAVDYGVKLSGCTVHFVDKGIDTGAIIIQKVVPIENDDTAESLSIKILREEHRAYPEAVRLFAEKRLKIRERRVFIDDE
ncbi:MAG: phosphoribosylglycinamide formyltransferase [Candidatus Krumholzibacteria bacterium]|nr:phosphoribosylglycinamide formyltransferase [Candidatus Krumholzibacteria bacterium]